jgi:hypothetical protein
VSSELVVGGGAVGLGTAAVRSAQRASSTTAGGGGGAKSKKQEARSKKPMPITSYYQLPTSKLAVFSRCFAFASRFASFGVQTTNHALL